ncbi:hypothetical protein ACFYNO_25785 [Kitasatospora sp. NPDC006697]|uniref:hypothetical protein n=1 Tax=Kitasatospora sp. NPDC006697 TaxID=3364020 RepID=UPI0036C17965
MSAPTDRPADSGRRSRRAAPPTQARRGAPQQQRRPQQAAEPERNPFVAVLVRIGELALFGLFVGLPVLMLSGLCLVGLVALLMH